VGQRRIASDVLAVIGAILMPLSLSFDWYHVNTGDSTFDVSGWNAFELADFALLAAAAFTLVCVARAREVPEWSARALLGSGATVLGLVLVEMIDKPPFLGFGLHSSLRAGAVIALAGAICVLAAGALSLLARPAARQPRGL
jgi:hypothetical protein